ncbi:hypothetical protein Rhe02_18850 [Rhizocola hellebori]|uniref:Uncharacterized protein n=1 Tax=Rhizocola hellebori TaxID=1392758 RepID=A0A8J3Q5U6_9ACTN|nr:hypothetical protein [Rhizocola hellebori]GIH03818.1 hypothetical protein Rhe02_18850 [Rhizocola hellebori]
MSSGIATGDRMVAGYRGIEELGTGFVDTIVWAIGVQRYLKVEGFGFGAGLVDGLLLGAPQVGPPPQRLVLGRSPGLTPADSSKALARAENLIAFNAGGFLIPPWLAHFGRGLGWGLWGELKGMWDLGSVLLSGSPVAQLTAGLRAAFDMLEKQPSFGFALGQQIGGDMVKDVMTAAEGNDFGTFVYEVGKVLGPFLLDILGAIISGGAGPLVKRGAKAAVEFGGELAQALTRRVRRGFDDLVEAAELATGSGPEFAYPDGIPGPRSRWDEPPNAVFADKEKLTGPVDRGTGSRSGSGSGSGPSGPDGPDGPGDPFDPRAAGAGAVGTDVVRRIGDYDIPRGHRDIVAQVLANWALDVGSLNRGVLRNSLRSFRGSVWRELVLLDGARIAETWAGRQALAIQALQQLADPQVRQILESLRSGAEQQIVDAFKFTESMHQIINAGGPMVPVRDRIADFFGRRGGVFHTNSAISLARAWRIEKAGMEEIRLVHVTNPIVQMFLSGFEPEFRRLLPEGYRLGHVSRPGWPVGDADLGPHAEILSALELSDIGAVVGTVATSQVGCNNCIAQLTRSYDWLLHLNPKQP